MGILSGFQAFKKYKKTSSGYKLQSQWTSSDTVELSSGKSLTKAIADGDISGGKTKTQAEYNALSETEKNNGTYYIPDAPDGLTPAEVDDRVTKLKDEVTKISRKVSKIEELLKTLTES